VANLLGYEQAYVSAIELGSILPSQEYLLRFAQKLDLNAEEHTELLVAAKTSLRRFVLPIGVAIETYLLCFELWEKIDRWQLHKSVACRSKSQ
jgi:transcriptional regulator with XRE-family HTH domain